MIMVKDLLVMMVNGPSSNDAMAPSSNDDQGLLMLLTFF